jgi:hypothetical protein
MIASHCCVYCILVTNFLSDFRSEKFDTWEVEETSHSSTTAATTRNVPCWKNKKEPPHVLLFSVIIFLCVLGLFFKCFCRIEKEVAYLEDQNTIVRHVFQVRFHFLMVSFFESSCLFLFVDIDHRKWYKLGWRWWIAWTLPQFEWAFVIWVSLCNRTKTTTEGANLNFFFFLL